MGRGAQRCSPLPDPWIDVRLRDTVTIGGSRNLFNTVRASYRSNKTFREEMSRHDRQVYGPVDKYDEPGESGGGSVTWFTAVLRAGRYVTIVVTASMEIGWTCVDPAVYHKNPALLHPRIQSKEVQYANALILGPRHV